MLLVSDGKDRTVNVVPCAHSGEKFLGELSDDTPLVGAGVLSLVDQDMVDPLVELVLDPRSRILPCQQTHCAGDEVIEVEKPARALQPLVSRNQPVGDDQSGLRTFQHVEQRDPVADIAYPHRHSLERFGKAGEMIGNSL